MVWHVRGSLAVAITLCVYVAGASPDCEAQRAQIYGSSICKSTDPQQPLTPAQTEACKIGVEIGKEIACDYDASNTNSKAIEAARGAACKAMIKLDENEACIQGFSTAVNKIHEELIAAEKIRAIKKKQERDRQEKQKRREEAIRARQEEKEEKERRRLVTEQARKEAEEKARKEAEEQKKHEQEEKTRKEAEEKAKREQEEKARKEAEEKARKEAEEQARKEAEEQARKEAEEKAKREAEEKAKREAEEQARKEAEEKARKEAEEQEKHEQEEKTRKEAEEKAKREQEEKTRKEAEEKARKEAEEKAKREAEEKEKIRIKAEVKDLPFHLNAEFSLISASTRQSGFFPLKSSFGVGLYLPQHAFEKSFRSHLCDTSTTLDAETFSRVLRDTSMVLVFSQLSLTNFEQWLKNEVDASPPLKAEELDSVDRELLQITCDAGMNNCTELFQRLALDCPSLLDLRPGIHTAGFVLAKCHRHFKLNCSPKNHNFGCELISTAANTALETYEITAAGQTSSFFEMSRLIFKGLADHTGCSYGGLYDMAMLKEKLLTQHVTIRLRGPSRVMDLLLWYLQAELNLPNTYIKVKASHTSTDLLGNYGFDSDMREYDALTKAWREIETTLGKLKITANQKMSEREKRELAFGKDWQTLKIGIFGKVGVGKSTLLNAIVGRDVSPRNSEICTGALVELAASNSNEEEHAVIRFASEAVVNRSITDVHRRYRETNGQLNNCTEECTSLEQETTKLLKQKNELKRFRKEYIMRKNTSSKVSLKRLVDFTSIENEDGSTNFLPDIVTKVVVKLDVPMLEYVTIIDTPGLDDANLVRTNATRRATEEMHVMLYMAEASDKPNQSMKPHIKKVREIRAAAGKEDDAPLLFVLNKLNKFTEWTSNTRKQKSFKEALTKRRVEYTNQLKLKQEIPAINAFGLWELYAAFAPDAEIRSPNDTTDFLRDIVEREHGLRYIQRLQPDLPSITGQKMPTHFVDAFKKLAGDALGTSMAYNQLKDILLDTSGILPLMQQIRSVTEAAIEHRTRVKRSTLMRLLREREVSVQGDLELAKQKASWMADNFDEYITKLEKEIKNLRRIRKRLQQAYKRWQNECRPGVLESLDREKRGLTDLVQAEISNRQDKVLKLFERRTDLNDQLKDIKLFGTVTIDLYSDFDAGLSSQIHYKLIKKKEFMKIAKKWLKICNLDISYVPPHYNVHGTELNHDDFGKIERKMDRTKLRPYRYHQIERYFETYLGLTTTRQQFRTQMQQQTKTSLLQRGKAFLTHFESHVYSEVQKETKQIIQEMDSDINKILSRISTDIDDTENLKKDAGLLNRRIVALKEDAEVLRRFEVKHQPNKVVKDEEVSDEEVSDEEISDEEVSDEEISDEEDDDEQHRPSTSSWNAWSFLGTIGIIIAGHLCKAELEAKRAAKNAEKEAAEAAKKEAEEQAAREKEVAEAAKKEAEEQAAREKEAAEAAKKEAEEQAAREKEAAEAEGREADEAVQREVGALRQSLEVTAPRAGKGALNNPRAQLTVTRTYANAQNLLQEGFHAAETNKHMAISKIEKGINWLFKAYQEERDPQKKKQYKERLPQYTKYCKSLKAEVDVASKYNEYVKREQLSNDQKEPAIIAPATKTDNLMSTDTKDTSTALQLGDAGINLDQEFEHLVGQQQIKDDLKALQHQLQMDTRRKQLGFQVHDSPASHLHMLFKGNPGVGKTKVARLVARVLKQCGVVAKGHLVEVQRQDLVGSYVGQTAPKTKAVVESAKGGVLFVDEAYRLVTGGENDFGAEAIDELMEVMNLGDPIMIFAGYKEQMAEFLESNAGLFRRIQKHFEFEDYTPLQLAKIVQVMVDKQRFRLAPPADNTEILATIIEHHTTQWQRSRMNGGLAAQIVSRAKQKLDLRMTVQSTLEDMCTYVVGDIVEATTEIPVPPNNPTEAEKPVEALDIPTQKEDATARQPPPPTNEERLQGCAIDTAGVVEGWQPETIGTRGTPVTPQGIELVLPNITPTQSDTEVKPLKLDEFDSHEEFMLAHELLRSGIDMRQVLTDEGDVDISCERELPTVPFLADGSIEDIEKAIHDDDLKCEILQEQDAKLSQLRVDFQSQLDSLAQIVEENPELKRLAGEIEDLHKKNAAQAEISEKQRLFDNRLRMITTAAQVIGTATSVYSTYSAIAAATLSTGAAATATGAAATATGAAATATGAAATATGAAATATGAAATATGAAATATGAAATATGAAATATGAAGTSAVSATASGASATASGASATASAVSATASAVSATASGAFAAASAGAAIGGQLGATVGSMIPGAGTAVGGVLGGVAGGVLGAVSPLIAIRHTLGM